MSEMLERDAAAFFSHVEFEPNSGCWLWAGPTAGKMGYGRFFRHGRQYQAHKWLYETTVGRPIAPLFALHRCDTPCCVNPHHIFLGSKAENNKDRNAKGRAATGVRNGQAKLNAEAVAVIRTSGAPTADLAQRFGVHIATIKRARRGDHWSI